jgi:hypothetical protein
LGAFKDGIGHAVEAAMHLGQGIDSGRGRGRRSRRANLGKQAAGSEKKCD